MYWAFLFLYLMFDMQMYHRGSIIYCNTIHGNACICDNNNIEIKYKVFNILQLCTMVRHILLYA